jgi:hypothetical protein
MQEALASISNISGNVTKFSYINPFNAEQLKS